LNLYKHRLVEAMAVIIINHLQYANQGQSQQLQQTFPKMDPP
jgi:hypothetical protein